MGNRLLTGKTGNRWAPGGQQAGNSWSCDGQQAGRTGRAVGNQKSNQFLPEFLAKYVGDMVGKSSVLISNI